MAGLTTLGVVHTAISLVAVAAGLVALARDRHISARNATGWLYVITTAITCLTGLGIFRHGAFGAPHVLAIITLLVLGLAVLSSTPKLFGGASPYVETVSYSATFFFHMIPGFTETATRLPAGAPLVASPEAPALQAAIGLAFAVFLIGATLQVRQLRARARTVSSRPDVVGAP